MSETANSKDGQTSASGAGKLHPDGAHGSVRVRRHDPLQLEIKVEHQIHEQQHRSVRAELDLWFFLPPAVGITPGSYSTDRFFEDLRVFTRLKTPAFSLAQLADPDDRKAPLGRLYERVRSLPDGTLPKKRERRLRHDCKLLVVATRAALRVDLDPDLDESEVLTAHHSHAQLLDQAQELVDNFRSLRPLLKQRKLSKRTRRCLSFADEYLSVLIEYAAVEAMSQIEVLQTSETELQKVVDRLRELASREVAYRRDQGLRSVLTSSTDDPMGRAAYLDQASLLKKYFGSVLYLNLSRDRTDGWAEQLALAFAAALAMVWAIALQIFTFFALDIDLSHNMGTNLLVIFGIIGVLGYIMKDRIKATVGSYLRGLIPQWLSDRRYDVMNSADDPGFARIRERMAFTRSDTVPEAVADARLASLRSRLVAEAELDVLHYRRQIEIKSKSVREQVDHFEGLSDIIRLNIWRWKQTLSAANKPVQILDQNGQSTVVQAPNDYLVDLLYRYRIGVSEEEQERNTQIQKVRLFLTQEGLKRVIEVDD